ncbi:hypothetical protein SAMN05421858_3134 [Haladaptatus litoreus]|uniref:Uncharacterized protein n=1 Tax=Haladaptatus litoreus TaxID=553468 RepID=A0A1N7CP75_9EURY|nr:hypothetical protein SAMN05421858_3134 [Haladaptatus litoreus]
MVTRLGYREVATHYGCAYTNDGYRVMEEMAERVPGQERSPTTLLFSSYRSQVPPNRPTRVLRSILSCYGPGPGEHVLYVTTLSNDLYYLQYSYYNEYEHTETKLDHYGRTLLWDVHQVAHVRHCRVH